MNKFTTLTAAALLSTSALAATPENGWWWNPAESGSGFNIEVQRGKMFVSAFAYDTQGNPVWYSGSADAGESRTNVELLRYEGGQCPGCDYTKPALSGGSLNATFDFTSSANGRVTLLGKTSTILRLNFGYGANGDKMLGEWVLVSEDIGSNGKYLGADRIVFNEIDEDGWASGTRRGVPYIVAHAGELNNKAEGFTHIMIVGKEGGLGNAYFFKFSGLNKIEGKYTNISMDKGQEYWFQWAMDGNDFGGYRIK